MLFVSTSVIAGTNPIPAENQAVAASKVQQQSKKVTISGVVTDGNMPAPRADVYTIDGRLVRTAGRDVTAAEAVKGLPKGLYIVGGRKVVVR